MSLFKEAAVFSVISFKIRLVVLEKFAFCWHFWPRTNCLGCFNCDTVQKKLVFVYLKKHCHYLKTLYFLYKQFQYKASVVLWNVAVFSNFWIKTNYGGHVNNETAKDLVRLQPFEAISDKLLLPSIIFNFYKNCMNIYF